MIISIKYSTTKLRMSKKEKLIERLLRKPVDMRFDEVKVILEHFGFTLDKKNQKGSHFVFFKEVRSDDYSGSTITWSKEHIYRL